jgi:glycosyltransferase involved in cell wall biosynthesis
MGRPVIATTAGGIPDIVRSEVEGLLIPPGNPEALARGLLRLFRNPGEGEKWAVAARERAGHEFSVEVMTRRIEAVYRILLGSPGP